MLNMEYRVDIRGFAGDHIRRPRLLRICLRLYHCARMGVLVGVVVVQMMVGLLSPGMRRNIQ